MAPLIREATAADAAAMVELLLEIQETHVASMPQFFQPIERGESIVAFLRTMIGQERSRVFVADLNGDLVGYVFARVNDSPPLPFFTPRRFVEVDTLVVGRRAQSQGIGRALMERAQEWGIEQGADQARLSVYEFNSGAIEFYEELGYVAARRTMWRLLD